MLASATSTSPIVARISSLPAHFRVQILNQTNQQLPERVVSSLLLLIFETQQDQDPWLFSEIDGTTPVLAKTLHKSIIAPDAVHSFETLDRSPHFARALIQAWPSLGAEQIKSKLVAKSENHDYVVARHSTNEVCSAGTNRCMASHHRNLTVPKRSNRVSCCLVMSGTRWNHSQ